MLVLARKVGEKICIGPDCTLVVVEIRGDKVRLGFEADPSVEIDRAEVRQAKEREAMRVRFKTPDATRFQHPGHLYLELPERLRTIPIVTARVRARICPACKGGGIRGSAACKACRGTGER